jgi:phosphohistidine phosphatase
MATKTLIVLRHAKSSWQTTESDQRRPLSERGERDAVAAGEILAGYTIDKVLASAATRVRLTWEGAQDGGAECDRVRYSESIYHAWPGELLSLIQGFKESDSTVVLIGHQPTLSELILTLAKPNELTERVAKKFPTCGLAVLTFRGKWKNLDEGKATLSRFEIPRG